MNEREVVYGLLSMLLPWALVLVIFGYCALFPANAEDVRASPDEEVVENEPGENAGAVDAVVEPEQEPVETEEPVEFGGAVVSEESVEPVEEPAEEPVGETVEPAEEPVEEPAEEPVEQPVEPAEEPVEPVTPQIVNDAAFLIAGCVLFGVMFLAGLIFSRYVPGGFVRG